MAKSTMHDDYTAVSFSLDNIEEVVAVVNASANAELACLQNWLYYSKLSLTVFKTRAIRLGSQKTFRNIYKQIVPRPRFQINDSDIDLLKETMCLGRILYDSLTWETAVECIRT